MKLAVIKTGGKQYLVKEAEELIVDKLEGKEGDKLNLETLAMFDEEKKLFEVGKPTLKDTVQAQLLEHLKGDKIRISYFKAKVRYRKTKGFRPQLTKIKIIKI